MKFPNSNKEILVTLEDKLIEIDKTHQAVCIIETRAEERNDFDLYLKAREVHAEVHDEIEKLADKTFDAIVDKAIAQDEVAQRLEVSGYVTFGKMNFGDEIDRVNRDKIKVAELVELEDKQLVSNAPELAANAIDHVNNSKEAAQFDADFSRFLNRRGLFSANRSHKVTNMPESFKEELSATLLRRHG